jgi:uncharacterized protein DUF4279
MMEIRHRKRPQIASQLFICNLAMRKGKPIVRETGAWQLDAAGQQPGNLDAHVAELFRRVNNDLSAWATLSREYKIDLFCAYFMGEANEPLQASAKTLKILGDRGIKLGLRVYSPAEDRL